LVWSVWVFGGQHSCGSCRCFRERGGTVEYGDSEALSIEFKSKREADNAGSGDADVGVVHCNSLVGAQTSYSLGISVWRMGSL